MGTLKLGIQESEPYPATTIVTNFISSQNLEYSELSQCKLLKNSEETIELDIFCFGLSLLEMISSDISGTHAFKVLCKIINKGGGQQILSSIEDEQLRDIITSCLESEPDKRATLDKLLAHPFLVKAENDHNPVPPCIQLTEVIKKYSQRRIHNRLASKIHKQSSSILDSMVSQMFMNSGIPLRGGERQTPCNYNQDIDRNRMKQHIRDSLGLGKPSTPLVQGIKTDYDAGTEGDTKVGGALKQQQIQRQNTEQNMPYNTSTSPQGDDSSSSFTKQMKQAAKRQTHKPSNFQPKYDKNHPQQKLYDLDNENDSSQRNQQLSDYSQSQINGMSQTTQNTGASPTMRQIIPASQLMTNKFGGSGLGTGLGANCSEIGNKEINREQPNQSINSPNHQESTGNIGLYSQLKPTRVIKMMIKVVNKHRLLEVRFNYDLDKDTPEGVVSEMKHELGLSEDIQIGILKLQIQKIVERFFNMPQVDITHATAMVPGASNTSQANSGGALNSRTQRIESLASQEANLRQQEMQYETQKQDSPKQDNNAAFNLKLNSAYDDPLPNEDCQQNEMQDDQISPDQYVKEDGDNDAPEEEAIIIDERGGAQEHHNQTMDEAYHHQNTKDEEVKKGQMIQCNVFNNPVNFVNSMILHDINDLNDPKCLACGNGEKEVSMKVDLSDKQRWKEEMEITLKGKKNDHQQIPQVQIPSPGINLIDGELDESSEIMYEQFIKEESTANILKDAFPGYSENYWHEHSLRNQQQINKANSQNLMAWNMNETLDLSHCSNSCPYMHQSRSISVDFNVTTGKETQLTLTPQQHQHHSHYPFKRDNFVLNPPPFIADDISIIIHHPGIRASSNEETKNDTHNHDQNHDCCYFFTEGMSSSLNINFNVTMNQQNNPQVQLNNAIHPQGLQQQSTIPTATYIQTVGGTSAITTGGGNYLVTLPVGPPALTPSPSAATTQNPKGAVSQIGGISFQRIHLNVSSNNDSNARMKCKNSIREVLGLLGKGNKDNYGKRRSDEMISNSTVPNSEKDLGVEVGNQKVFNQNDESKSKQDNQQREQDVIEDTDKKQISPRANNLEFVGSDTFNAKPGYCCLQNYILSTQQDPTQDGVIHTPIFCNSSEPYSQNHFAHQGSCPNYQPFSNSIQAIMNQEQMPQDENNQQTQSIAEPQLLILGGRQNFRNTQKQDSPNSRDAPQDQMKNSNRLYVFQSDEKDHEHKVYDYQQPVFQKNKSSIIPQSLDINLKESFQGFDSIKRFDTAKDLPQSLDLKFQQSDTVGSKKIKNSLPKKILTGLHKSSHDIEGTKHQNLSFHQDLKISAEEIKTARRDKDEELKPAIPLSADGNGYFHFDNQYSHQNHMNSQNLEGGATFCQHNMIFQQATMKSEKLQRKHKQMYKSDIVTLQKALKKIFGSEINYGEKGHFCPETCEYVKKFQEMYNYTVVDGVVDRPLYKVIMCEAMRISCEEPHEPRLNLSDENINQSSSAVPDINNLPSSSTSTFDQQSLTSNSSPTHMPYIDSIQQPITPAGSFQGINNSGEIIDKDTPMPLSQQNENFESATVGQEIDMIQLRNDEIRIPPDHSNPTTSQSHQQSHK